MVETKDLFRGLRVGAFESRRAEEMKRLIEKAGGQPHVSPSMKEIPLEENGEAVDFAHRLITGQIDVVLFMTGVGFRFLHDVVQRHVDSQRFLNALSDIVTVARGPKPVAAMKEVGIAPTYRVPAPNTWREVISLLDQEVNVSNQVIAIQEYGVSNPSLIAGLEARGATIVRVPVYRWGLPDDLQPLRDNVGRLVKAELDVVMFTSANQVHHLFQVADDLEQSDKVRNALRDIVVASIGPTTSETLRGLEIPVDLEPTHSKMGHLVIETARAAHDLQQRKRQLAELWAKTSTGASASDTNAAWHDSPFMRACRREPTDVTPIWLMRQAGRYMPEYRAVRSKVGFLELCKNPQLCSQVMCEAVQRLGVDAAIIFSDLLPILEPMGMDLEFAPGDGPVIHNPLREVDDIDRVVELESVDSLHFVMETVRQTRLDLPEDIPLIGFAGAPFTLASYMIEGGSSRNFLHTKTLMYRDEGAWTELMGRLSRSIARYLNAQIASGAQCVQLFDSWAGCLSQLDYRQFVKPFVQQIIAGLHPGVPVINFATGNPALLPELAQGGSTVVGIDWRVSLADAWQSIGYRHAVQGNLDPACLMATPETIRRRAREILLQAGGRPGHIFNLGHGVLPQTPVENAIALVEAVHDLSQS